MSEFSAFIGGYGRSQAPQANDATLQNLYLEISDTIGAKSPGVLYRTPGFQLFGSTSQVGGKAYFSTAAAASRVFKVIGMALFEEFSDGSSINRGAVAVNANPAQITWNGGGGQQLGICAGGSFYCYDMLTNILTPVAALAGKATQCGFISGYFLVFDIATGTVYQSDLYNGLVFDPANFFQRNVQADDWNAMYVLSWGQIFLPGTKTRDTYYNAGTFPIPFAPASQSGIQPEGCASTFSVKEFGNSIGWLGTTAQGGYKIYAASGYEAQAISNKAVEYSLSRYTQQELAQAVGESYSEKGHDFLLIKMPDITWTFDRQSNQWHTRRSFRTAAADQLGPWRATFHAFGFSKHLWLDSDSGKSYQSDATFPLDIDDLEIEWQRSTPSICVLNQMLDIGEIELKCATGIGNPGASALTTPGYQPMVGLEISTNGGRTWGRQRFMSLGREGEYLRVRWQANGSGRDVAFRFTGSDPVVGLALIELYVEMGDERGRQVDLGQAA